MRLWTLHPKYLDGRGLVALWREALLAQAVLAGRTLGYRHHPQLTRFRAHAHPSRLIATYLRTVHAESVTRGYLFDASRIVQPSGRQSAGMTVTRGQIAYEWKHLLLKLRSRDPDRWARNEGRRHPDAHPLFRVIAGDVEPWERIVRPVDDASR